MDRIQLSLSIAAVSILTAGMILLFRYLMPNDSGIIFAATSLMKQNFSSISSQPEGIKSPIVYSGAVLKSEMIIADEQTIINMYMPSRVRISVNFLSDENVMLDMYNEAAYRRWKESGQPQFRKAASMDAVKGFSKVLDINEGEGGTFYFIFTPAGSGAAAINFQITEVAKL